MNCPQRKSYRASFHDYSGGDYFVTICTYDKQHYFGEIKNGTMRYTAIGTYCVQQLQTLETHYPYASSLLFVVMPNHLHVIIHIDEESQHGSQLNALDELWVPAERTALSVIVGGLKRSITMFARRNGIEFGWQSRYYDHIIRGVQDGNHIAEYIESNIEKWASDCFHTS